MVRPHRAFIPMSGHARDHRRAAVLARARRRSVFLFRVSIAFIHFMTALTDNAGVLGEDEALLA